MGVTKPTDLPFGRYPRPGRPAPAPQIGTEDFGRDPGLLTGHLSCLLGGLTYPDAVILPIYAQLPVWGIYNMYVRNHFGSSRPFLAAYGGHGHGGIDEAKSTCPTPGVTRRPNPCLLRAESMSGLDGNQEVWGGLQPLYLLFLFLLGSLWDHFAPGVPHQGPWCTSPGQWLSWPKGDGVKCSRSEGPRRESRSEINHPHSFIACRSLEGRVRVDAVKNIKTHINKRSSH